MKVFKSERRGYSPSEVDEYVESLETKLARQELILNDYREKEGAINQSVVEAKLLANKMIEDAKKEADTIHQNALSSLADIKAQTKAMHEKLLAFQKEYNLILQQYLVAVRCSDMVSLFDDLNRFMDQLGMAKTEEEPVEITDLNVEEKS